MALVIASYSSNVVQSLNQRFDMEEGNEKIEFKLLIPLYMGAGYFALREIIQIISLLSLNVFKLWLYDPSNYLNVAFVVVVMAWTIMMQTGRGQNDSFRIGSAISVTVLWYKLIAYLRNILLDFAVFVRGVVYVVHRLAAFLISLGIILFAFAQMFHTVFQQTERCSQPAPDSNDLIVQEQTRCDASTLEPYCTFWDSFLSVYTMLLGELDEGQFVDSGVAIALFVLFMFLVVILLANVLIAIVTDSYKVIQVSSLSI